MSKKDKLLTLSGGRKFVIIDEVLYNGKMYYIANEIINDDTSDVFKIFSIKKNDKNDEILENIKNRDIIKAVCELLQKNVE